MGDLVVAHVLPNLDVSDLDATLLDPSGLVRVLPAREIDALDPTRLRVWLHKRAVYGLPTVELVDWIRSKIGSRTAIEIGSGNGALGRALGIPRTDSHLQARPEIRAYYRALGQPVIDYPADVEALDAAAAIKKYHPQVVVASWVTQLHRPGDLDGNAFGVDEDALLDQVEAYIHVGSEAAHGTKRILSRPHTVVKHPWIKGRGDGVIYQWERT